MCGRYALGIRASLIRQQLERDGMQIDDAPTDDSVRQTYNFAPGSYGLVYRADVPDWGSGGDIDAGDDQLDDDADSEVREGARRPTNYILQAMKWGLVPSWTKRNPDYGSLMRTINARDDSLKSPSGMWTSMKKTKRCVVVAQGFYEWLKKNDGKEKIPHFTKRTDGRLMCFAGLWDCVQYEGSQEKHYTYTIITTDSSKQLSFLHDRMPVILDNGSQEMQDWLNPGQIEWTKNLQSLLKPYRGLLDCYGVSQDVGKVGNNSPSFIIPVASAENKNNIANFFDGGRKASPSKSNGRITKIEAEDESLKTAALCTKELAVEDMTKENSEQGTKRKAEDEISRSANPHASTIQAEEAGIADTPAAKRKTRSATSNKSSPKSSPAKKTRAGVDQGSQKITSFLR